MVRDNGIIDRERNPFTIPSWIRQNLSFTSFRQKEFNLLIGKNEETIRSIGRDRGRYPAFVAIRWGFAEISDKILCATKNGITLKNTTKKEILNYKLWIQF